MLTLSRPSLMHDLCIWDPISHLLWIDTCLAKCLNRFLVVAAFNQEKAVISRLVIVYNFKLREGSFQALVARPWQVRGSRGHQVEQRLAGASRRLSLVREHEPWHARTHAHYDRDQPRVPFNTPEAATSSSSADSSPELPRRKEKVRASNFSKVRFKL